MSATSPPGGLRVRTLTAAEHLGFIRSRPSASFLQTPAWGEVKSEWEHESIGWYRPGSEHQLVGAGLVLYRRTPVLRRYLAYLPEGPTIDWTSEDLAAWLTPMVAHLAARRVFGVRIGPPVVLRRWSAAAVKAGMADESVNRLDEVPPTGRSPHAAGVLGRLRELGWQHQTVTEGFAAGQPPYNFQIPLAGDGGTRSPEDVLRGMNQQWRRNVRRAEKAGVDVCHGTQPDLPAFHDLYRRTAERDGFTPRPLAYFETMFRALSAEEPDRVRLYLARHEQELVAATIGIRVGEHVWYSYGASSTHKRDVRGSNAVQWLMIRDALAAGATVYDLRGITDTLDGEDPHVGLVRFKVGTGGEAVEYAGEWDLPVDRLLYRAFSLYMRRRG